MVVIDQKTNLKQEHDKFLNAVSHMAVNFPAFQSKKKE